ncbi:hypothetical protein DOI34_24635 [Salmonella enterica subsp. enterica serovar Virchow]|nr:hypothetical protein [Salmonella enterica subsp. enterica serovar Virchow]
MVSPQHGIYGPADLARLTTALDKVLATRGLPPKGPHRKWITRRLIDALDGGEGDLSREVSRLSQPPREL